MSALTDLFGQIADAIRAKSGSTAQIQASAFPTEIANLSGISAGFYSASNTRTLVCDNLIGKTYYAILCYENLTNKTDSRVICGTNYRESPTIGTTVQLLVSGSIMSAGLGRITFDNNTGTLTLNGAAYFKNTDKFLVIGW